MAKRKDRRAQPLEEIEGTVDVELQRGRYRRLREPLRSGGLPFKVSTSFVSCACQSLIDAVARQSRDGRDVVGQVFVKEPEDKEAGGLRVVAALAGVLGYCLQRLAHLKRVRLQQRTLGELGGIVVDD